MLNYLSVISIISIIGIVSYLFILNYKIDFLKEQILTKNAVTVNYEEECDEDDEECRIEESDLDETSEDESIGMEEMYDDNNIDIDNNIDKIYTIEEENVNSILDQMYNNHIDDDSIDGTNIDTRIDDDDVDIVVKKRGRPKKQ